MKGKTIIQILLAIVIVVLAWLLYSSIMKPVRFDSEFYTRRDACAVKLKTIRTLEESYKLTYSRYTGDFDTLVNRLLNEDSLLVSQKHYNYDKIPADVDYTEMPEAELIKKGYLEIRREYVNPIAQLREQGKLKYTDKDGGVHEFTDNDLKNLRYLPYPEGTKEEFQLAASQIDKGGFMMPVFECKVDLPTLMSDCDEQLVKNRVAEIEAVSGKYAGWKVGSLTETIVEGNFE